jgi:endonuclease/exonuclease/phosphatase family metal-dependent hydrolase
MASRLNLFSSNVKLLPKGLGGSAADDRRIGALATWLLQLLPDVICLQEVFSEDGRGVLKKKLAKAYPHMVAKSSDHDFLQEDSGLFFASRLPIESHRFVEYEAAAGTDQLSDKGVLGAVLDAGKKRKLLVFNTHMQASEGYADVRRRQVAQARRFVARSVRDKITPATKKLPNVAAVLVGDLNVIAERPLASEMQPTAEYTRAIALFGFPRDLYRETHKQPGKAGYAGYTWDGPTNKLANDGDRQRLDYALAFDSVPQADDNAPQKIELGTLQSVKIDVVDKLPNGAFFSDHYALMTSFELA